MEVYCICKQCLKEGSLFIAFSTNREKHMEKQHGLTGDELRKMIKKPRLYFLNFEQLADFAKS